MTHGKLTAGPQLDVPQDVTVQQLNTLLNGLLQNEEKLPYSFFVEEQELATSLGEHLHKNKVCMHSSDISFAHTVATLALSCMVLNSYAAILTLLHRKFAILLYHRALHIAASSAKLLQNRSTLHSALCDSTVLHFVSESSVWDQCFQSVSGDQLLKSLSRIMFWDQRLRPVSPASV